MFSGVWSTRENVAECFNILPLTDNIEIIFAHYSSYSDVDDNDYEMWARVLYRDNQNGKYYEVHASHCSCYGLENQWEPSEVDIADVYREANNTANNAWGSEGIVRERLLKSLEAI